MKKVTLVFMLVILSLGVTLCRAEERVVGGFYFALSKKSGPAIGDIYLNDVKAEVISSSGKMHICKLKVDYEILDIEEERSHLLFMVISDAEYADGDRLDDQILVYDGNKSYTSVLGNKTLRAFRATTRKEHAKAFEKYDQEQAARAQREKELEKEAQKRAEEERMRKAAEAERTKKAANEKARECFAKISIDPRKKVIVSKSICDNLDVVMFKEEKEQLEALEKGDVGKFAVTLNDRQFYAQNGYLTDEAIELACQNMRRNLNKSTAIEWHGEGMDIPCVMIFSVAANPKELGSKKKGRIIPGDLTKTLARVNLADAVTECCFVFCCGIQNMNMSANNRGPANSARTGMAKSRIDIDRISAKIERLMREIQKNEKLLEKAKDGKRKAFFDDALKEDRTELAKLEKELSALNGTENEFHKDVEVIEQKNNAEKERLTHQTEALTRGFKMAEVAFDTAEVEFNNLREQFVRGDIKEEEFVKRLRALKDRLCLDLRTASAD